MGIETPPKTLLFEEPLTRPLLEQKTTPAQHSQAAVPGCPR